MMSLAVAEDYSNTNPMEFPSPYKILLALSIVISTTVCALSFSQLGRNSAYLSPITSIFTIIHAVTLGTLCLRESRREPTFSPREPRMLATRRSNLAASYALYLLWVVTSILLIIATRHAAYWFFSPIERTRSAVEAGLAGVQSCVTFAFAVLCTRDRMRFHRRTRRQVWTWF